MIGKGSAIPVLAALAAGCSEAALTPASESQLDNPPTLEAQSALVSGLAPVVPRQRFLRTLGPEQTPQEAGLPVPANVDLSKTEAGLAWKVEAEKIARSKAEVPWPDDPGEGKERVVFVDGSSEWELEYDKAELQALADVAMARGIHHASSGAVDGEPLPPALKEQGWSGGVDSRVRKPINGTYPVNHRVLGRIGELDGGGCSGHLVGRRLLLTAAHCVVPPSGATVTHTVSIRRAGYDPYGVVSTSVYWYSGNWIPNNCHTNRVYDPCVQNDWALLRLPSSAWDSSPNGTPGWMGYWVYGQNYIRDNAVNYNDGYPACWLPGAPSTCTQYPRFPWGQTSGGTARGFDFLHDGVPAYYRTSRDQSGGHSGSPNWTDYPGPDGPYTIGIAVWEYCFGSDCANAPGDAATHPNGHRGMTPYLSNFITDKRVAYP